MSDAAMKCPACDAEIIPAARRCPNCGRPSGPRGFLFYSFWTALSLVVAALLFYIGHTAFQMVNRML